MAVHWNVVKLMVDIEIYVDGIASMQVQNLNSYVNLVRDTIEKKHRTGEQDRYICILNAAHINQDEYFRHVIRDDMGDFIKKMSRFSNIAYIHPVLEHSWGQRAVRFYDLDDHIIEVAENIAIIIKCFIDSGLTVEETARRMDVDVKYTNAALERLVD